MAVGVVGRDDELREIGAFLSELERGPAALVLVGAAGIGKTVLWQAAIHDAEARFGLVLSCRGVEAEASLSFAALSELLEPVLPGVLQDVPTPRRRALEVALLLAEPGESAPAPLAIGLALLHVLRVLSERSPLVVAADDLRWVDPASAAALQVAFRRLRDEPVGLLATMRDSPEETTVIEQSFEDVRLNHLTVGPLDAKALHTVLSQRVGIDLPHAEVLRVRDATAGNPFFAVELGRELARSGTLDPRQPLPVPESLARLLQMRLDRLSPTTTEVLLIVALAGRPTIDLIVAVQGDPRLVREALDEAKREGIIESRGGHVALSHPLFASVLQEHAPANVQRSTHLALAHTVADVEERAHHRAHGTLERDAEVADELEGAGDHAAARGAPSAAADLFELAADLTPDEVLARRRRLRAATLHRFAGKPARGRMLIDQLLGEVPSGVERADVLLELASAWYPGDPRSKVELCDEALVEATGDPARQSGIWAQRSAHDSWVADIPAQLADARKALHLADQVGDARLIAVSIARVALAESYAVQITPGLIERGVDLEVRHGLALEYEESPRYFMARKLRGLGRLDQSRTILHDLETEATARGAENTRVVVLWAQSMLEWMSGDWSRARHLSDAAYDLSTDIEHPHALNWVGRAKALLEVDLGLLEEARSSVEEGLAFVRQSHNELFTIVCLGTLGRLELAVGDLDAAAATLRDLPRRLIAGGILDPTIALWPDAIETLIAIGERDLAVEYLDVHQAQAEALDSPWALSTSARARGLLLARDGDTAGAIAALEKALAALEGVDHPFERARALLALGVLRRQTQQKAYARGAIGEALAIFERLGARLWADKARTELGRISGRPPAPSELTGTEHQVATLAAEGRSNREIAADMHLGVSTVEAHLSSVYRKLGVKRAELGARLRDDAPGG